MYASCRLGNDRVPDPVGSGNAATRLARRIRLADVTVTQRVKLAMKGRQVVRDDLAA